MQDPTLAIVAICAFALICGGLIAIVGFLVLRFTGRSLGGILGEGGIPGMIDTLADEDDDPLQSSRRRRRTGGEDLRAKAQSLDFDAAVAKYKDQPASQSAPISRSPFPPPPPPPERELPDTSARLRRKRRKQEDDGDEGDEMYEHFLDEE
jgi:hypothetical protein